MFARRPIVRTLVFAAVGANIAVLLAGRAGAEVGPFDTTVVVRPAMEGRTVLRLAPLGSIELDTHSGPLAIELRVDELRPDEAERYVSDPALLRGVGDDLAADARQALRGVALRALLASVVGGVLGAVAARVAWRDALTGGAVGAAMAVAFGATAALTFRAEAVSEPRYTGLLTVAPQAVGDVEDVLDRFDDYRAQLAGLVGNVATLYRAVEGLPNLDPGDDAIRVLHIADIHNNPQGFDLAAQLVRQFDIDVVIDAGDITDWGTAPESRLLDQIEELDAPYVWVRGNHDSRQTQRAVAARENAIVLDGDAVDVAGLRIWGIGDPRFTPDQGEDNDFDSQMARIERFTFDAERSLRDAEPPPVDIAVVHDPRAAARLGDHVPLVLAGHMHEPSVEHLGETMVLIEGSTGGAGLRSLEHETPEPLTASVLYFDPDTTRLVAYDRIEVEGLGGAGVRIQRHTVESDATVLEERVVSGPS